MSRLPKTSNSASTTAGFEFVKRHNVRRTEDYWCELDEYENASGDKLLLAHIGVYRWTPSIAKQLIREFKLFRTACPSPIFACHDADAKWFKFVSMLGFRFLQHIKCEDGVTRQLFIHTT
jgi:hypothetical protein